MLSKYDNYVESEVLTADPIKLVALLYRGAFDAVQAARVALQAGDIRGRSKQITKASCILNELALSLDHSKGPEITRPLVEVYDYMQRCLIEANSQQIEAPLIQVEQLLATLAEAWQSISPRVDLESAGIEAYAAAQAAEYESLSCTY